MTETASSKVSCLGRQRSARELKIMHTVAGLYVLVEAGRHWGMCWTIKMKMRVIILC